MAKAAEKIREFRRRSEVSAHQPAEGEACPGSHQGPPRRAGAQHRSLQHQAHGACGLKKVLRSAIQNGNLRLAGSRDSMSMSTTSTSHCNRERRSTHEAHPPLPQWAAPSATSAGSHTSIVTVAEKKSATAVSAAAETTSAPATKKTTKKAATKTAAKPAAKKAAAKKPAAKKAAKVSSFL